MVLLVEALLLECCSVVVVAWSHFVAGHHPRSLGLGLKHRVLVLLCFVSLHLHFELVDAAIWPFVLYGSLQRIPVHFEELFLVLWVRGLLLKTFLFAVERSFFDVYLL